MKIKKTYILIGLLAFALIVISLTYFLTQKDTSSYINGELSKEKEFVEWISQPSDPNILDGGEQPGWTKLKEKCDALINNKNDAKVCLENYEQKIKENYWRERGDNRTVNAVIDLEKIVKGTIIIKHDLNNENTTPIYPDMPASPTIEPYSIEIFRVHNIRAVDWEGNIYQYQTWA